MSRTETFEARHDCPAAARLRLTWGLADTVSDLSRTMDLADLYRHLADCLSCQYRRGAFKSVTGEY